MLAPVNCDRTLVSKELFARHSNYVLPRCNLVSVQAECIAALDSMPRLQFCRRLKLTNEKCDHSSVLCCCSGSGSEPAPTPWPRDFRCFPPYFRDVSVHLATTNTSIRSPVSPWWDALAYVGRATYLSQERPPRGINWSCNFDGYRSNTSGLRKPRFW